MFKKFSEKTIRKTHSTAQIALIAAILIGLNILLAPINIRADLTEDKQFTLTETTVKLLKNLDDVVNIEVYFSQEVPSHLLSVRQATGDILEEYKTLSNGKIRVKWIDPKDDPELKNQAQSLGVPELQFNVLERDAFQVTTGFAGLVIFYEDETEVLPAIESTENLEYDLTASVLKLTAEETPVIAFTDGHQEQDTSYLFDFLQRQYTARRLDTTDGAMIADDVKTLIIAGPQKEFSEREKYAVDQFLMKGKNVILLQDSVNIDQNLQTTTIDSGLEELIGHYGVTLENTLVIDPMSNENVTFGGGLFQIVTSYPYWPKIIQPGFDQDSAITNRLQSLVLPWTRSLMIPQESSSNKTSTILAKTSANSFNQKEPFNLNPQQEFSAGSSSAKEPQNVAVLRQGSFESFFKGKDVPVRENVTDEATEDSDRIDQVEQAKLVVIGDSDFIREDVAKQFPDNIIFLANAIDSLTLDESLNAIRSRGLTDRPLKTLSDQEKISVRFGAIGGSLLLVLLLGIGQWRWRIMRTKKISHLISS